MRNWVPWVLVLLLGWVCLLLGTPVSGTPVTSYICFVTVMGWVAVVCIVAFLVYALHHTSKR